MPLSDLIDHIRTREHLSGPQTLEGRSMYWAQQDLAREGSFLSNLVRAPTPHKPLNGYFRPITYRVSEYSDQGRGLRMYEHNFIKIPHNFLKGKYLHIL